MFRVPGESQLSILVGIGRIAHIFAEKNPLQAGTQPACLLLPRAPGHSGCPCSGMAALGLCFQGAQEKRAGAALCWDFTAKF